MGSPDVVSPGGTSSAKGVPTIEPCIVACLLIPIYISRLSHCGLMSYGYNLLPYIVCNINASVRRQPENQQLEAACSTINITLKF